MSSAGISRLPPGDYTVKLGDSFYPNKKGGIVYHTLRYDFKSSYESVQKDSFIELGDKGDTTVIVPKVDLPESAKDITLYRGSKRPYQKECVLILDHETRQMRLELLDGNIQVKKTRGEVSTHYLEVVRKMRGVSNSNSVKTANALRAASGGLSAINELNDDQKDSSSEDDSSSSDGEESSSSDDVGGDDDDQLASLEEELYKETPPATSNFNGNKSDIFVPRVAPIKNDAFVTTLINGGGASAGRSLNGVSQPSAEKLSRTPGLLHDDLQLSDDSESD